MSEPLHYPLSPDDPRCALRENVIKALNQTPVERTRTSHQVRSSEKQESLPLGVGSVNEFKWHRMSDEMPETGVGDYVIKGARGAMYYANAFKQFSSGKRSHYFYVVNNRSPNISFIELWRQRQKPPASAVGRKAFPQVVI